MMVVDGLGRGHRDVRWLKEDGEERQDLELT